MGLGIAEPSISDRYLGKMILMLSLLKRSVLKLIRYRK